MRFPKQRPSLHTDFSSLMLERMEKIISWKGLQLMEAKEKVHYPLQHLRFLVPGQPFQCTNMFFYSSPQALLIFYIRTATPYSLLLRVVNLIS